MYVLFLILLVDLTLNSRINATNIVRNVKATKLTQPIYTATTSDGKVCNEINSFFYDVKWPSTSNKTLSVPPCVDEHKELVYRECLNGRWISEPNCDYIQKTSSCPDGFTETADICYKFTTETFFPPKCLFDKVLPFNDYIYMIARKLPEAVWMPVQRDLSNGIGFLQWVEHTQLYKTPFNDSYIYNGRIKNKNCVILYRNGTKKAVSCYESYPGVCAYKKLDKLEDTLCKKEQNCRQSDFTARNRCFCSSRTSAISSLAEFIEPYQNYLTNETCTIGLIKTADKTYIWSSSKTKISYSFWSPEVIFDDRHVYGASSSSGWLLTEEPQPCHLVEKTVTMPRLTLSFYGDTKSFYLYVSDLDLIILDGSPTVFFFASVGYSIVRREILTLNSTNHEIPNIWSSGIFWVEAIHRYNSNIVESEKLVISDLKTDEWAAIFEVTYPPTINPLSENITIYLEEILLNKFRNAESDYKAEFVKIIDLDEEQHLLWVNIHLKSNDSVAFADVETNYKNVQKLINKVLNILKNRNLFLLSLSSLYFCMNEIIFYPQGNFIIWPTVPIGAQSIPEDFYCFTVYGNQVSRFCKMNFVDGSSFDNMDKCTVLDKSLISDDLIRMLKDDDTDLEIVNNFLRSYSISLSNPLDVYLLKSTLGKVIANGNINITSFGKIINSILKFDRTTLVNSQEVTRSTDHLLGLIKDVIRINSTPIQFIGDQFVILKNLSKDISGVMVQLIDEKKEITKLEGNWFLEKIQKQKNVVSAVWISPELKTIIGDNTNLTFILYFNDGLFGETCTSENIVSAVYGVTINDSISYKILPEAINIYESYKNNNRLKKNCSFWNYEINLQAGFWLGTGNLISADQGILCQFWQSGDFALVENSDQFVTSKITPSLVKLLESKYEPVIQVVTLANISQDYKDFGPTDVFLFGKILEVVNETQVDLEALSKSVDNLHKINRTVLEESQDQRQATDQILKFTDAIIQKCNITSEVMYKNEDFVVFISNLREHDVGGLAVVKDNQTVDVIVLRGHVSLERLMSYENIDSAVILSSKLRRQLIRSSQFIITIFFNDSLFNSKSRSFHNISTIFGVILPEIGTFDGPVTVFHNISTTTPKTDCSFWAFKNSPKNLSLWKRDNEGQKSSTFIRCDYWHTTHFALLLLNTEIYGANKQILELITYVNVTISFLSLLGIVLTAVLFEKWRRNVGNQILFNFTVSIMIQIAAFFGVFTLKAQSELNCTIIGVLLHYSIVAQFCWMFVIAILQFKRFVKVFGTSSRYLLLRACCIGWGIPIIPITTSLVIDRNNYAKSKMGFCYPSGLGLYLGIWIPILIIISANLTIFIYIIYNVIQRKIEASIPSQNDGKYEWRLFVLLFFMLGLTWSFGFLAGFEYGVIFAYLFCLTATMQGFVLFIYFIVLNSNTRQMYRQFFRNYCYRKDQ